MREGAETPQQSSHTVDAGPEDEAAPEPDIVVHEGGEQAAGDPHVERDGAQQVDGVDVLVEVDCRHVGHGGVAHPQRVGGEVEQRHGGQHEPSPRVALVLTRARYREELNNCIDREALKTENI